MHYPVVIHHMFISPGHNYFGRPKDGPGDHPTLDVEEVEARARLGLVGDRYFGVQAHFDAQITFIAWEVFSTVQAELRLPGLSPAFMRRNVVVEGVPLNQLIEREFALDFGPDFGGQGVRFLGVRHCAPCAWMDAMLGPGAWALLKGRGGLRARILSNGVLRRGPALLHTEAALDLAAITQPIAYPKLP